MEERTPAVLFHQRRARNTDAFVRVLANHPYYSNEVWEGVKALVYHPAGLDLSRTVGTSANLVHHMAERCPVAWLEHLSRQDDAQAAFRVVDDRGWTPLHHAVGRGSPEVVAFLIDQAPELLNQVDSENSTPLTIAIDRRPLHEGRWGVLEALLRAGAEGDAVSMMKRFYPRDTGAHERLEELVSLVQSELRGPPK